MSHPFSHELSLGRIDCHPARLLTFAGTLFVAAAWSPALLWLLGVLTFIIGVHEAAHFTGAIRTGMRPVDYSIGMGWSLISHKSRNGATYHLRSLPIGGFVKIPGMNSKEELPEGVAESETYRAATASRRLLTILAGPLANIFVAYVLFVHTEASIVGGAKTLWSFIALNLTTLPSAATTLPDQVATLFAGEAPSTPVMSVIGQAELTEQIQAGVGPVSQTVWIAILSAAIGTFNIFPLAPLDGWHALTAGSERVSRIFGAKAQQRTAAGLELISKPFAYLVLGVVLTVSVMALFADLMT